MKTFRIPLLIAFLTLGFAGSAVAAGDAAKQLATATAHAQMAAASHDLAMIHAHLHHVVNCLVGTRGKGFDAKAENPCQGMGNGAIPDFAGTADAKAKLDMAVEAAEHGIKDGKYQAAHKSAMQVVKLIKEASPAA